MSEQQGASSRLYVPLKPVVGGATVRSVELRGLADGRVGLTAYTSLASLVRSCGDGQPWGLVDDGGLDEILASFDIDVVLLDAELPARDKRFREPEARQSSYMTDPVR